MELKCIRNTTNEKGKIGFNCTFMELKYENMSAEEAEALF